MSGGEPKISYDRWVYGKSLMERLRTEGGFSLTEVSRIACGNGGTPGWADNAREHRSIMREHQIRNMETYLNGKAPGRGVRIGDARLSAGQQQEYSKLVQRLRTVYGWTTAQIGAALNIAQSTVSNAASSGSGTLHKLETARAIVLQLDRAAKNGKPEGRTEEVPPAPVSVAAPTPRGLLGSAISAGTVFVEALGKLEAEMPPFARKAAQELTDRARALVAELQEGK